MRSLALSLILCAAGTSIARADAQFEISYSAPLSNLPAVSGDGDRYARPIVVRPAGCEGAQHFIEYGELGAAPRDRAPTMLMVRDDCGGASPKALTRNIDQINDFVVGHGFHTIGSRRSRPLPAVLEVDGGTVKVSVGGSGRSVTIARGEDRWTIGLEAPISELRGWYLTRSSDGASHLAIAVATLGDDTAPGGRERWVEVSSGVPEAPSGPVAAAAAWMEALRDRDRAALAQQTSVPFWRVGIEPASGARGKACRKRSSREARSEADVARVVRCMTDGVSELYDRYSGVEHLAEIGLDELPPELKQHRAKVAALVRDGATLVRYHVNEDGLYVFLILVLDPDDPTKVRAVLESIDVEPE